MSDAASDASESLPKTYQPAEHEAAASQRWIDANAFAARPDARDARYVVMMPLPNVTGALHMGHAMDNVMQDLLIRWHRMRGANALWQPGTDHAGIATQAVVERRLRDNEGLTRHDLGREALVQRIWDWKEEYQARIISQQQAMGCSCDWERQRFTMDEVCSAAVREAFFRMFADRLIFRGDRLVNWDCHLQTAVANDEVYYTEVQGHFWHLKYPVIDPQDGEPTHVTVATTRPETMLGDTAVACHPDPKAALAAEQTRLGERLAKASEKEKPEIAEQLAALETRIAEYLPTLELLASMARDGRTIRLPLMDREIPLICDEWAKPALGSGCVKITPGHDPNDYEVWGRHAERIGIINILADDGTLNANAGGYAGMERAAAREKVVADLEAAGLLDRVEDRAVEIAHSDRSKTAVEPKLSKQWFVRMGDVEGGIECGAGAKTFRAPGLAQAAIDAATGWTSPSGRGVDFHPDSDRYRRGYVDWLSEKRDWCISRQLWWGHRIPVWWARFDTTAAADAADALAAAVDGLPDGGARMTAFVGEDDGTQHAPADGVALAKAHPERGPFELQVCLRGAEDDGPLGASLEALGLERDPDVLDTWFSSALWPFSTLGWPDPAGAKIGEGQTSLADSLDYYYPGSCLVTGRDILTLWVARMVVMGLYHLGDVPFTDVFLHAKILDGNGVTMSKSKGNGVDPKDIIDRYGADAMRFVICDLQTGLQDVRLPVQADCPHAACAKQIELADAKHKENADGSVNIFVYVCPHCGGELDVLGTMGEQGIPRAAIYAERFEIGRKFCNKLYNSTRFALLNLGEPAAWQPRTDFAEEDRWIFSRLSRAIATVDAQIAAYNPSAALGAARDFFWNDLCDWYLELIKPRMRDEGSESQAMARQVLTTVLDQTLRLLHPFVPFITESLWAALGRCAPERGVGSALEVTDLCLHAPWPVADTAREDDALEADFALMQSVVSAIRELRASHNVPPRKALPAALRCSGETAAALERVAHHIRNLNALSALEVGDVEAPPNAASTLIGEVEIALGEVLDPEVERQRLTKRKGELEGSIARAEGKLGNEKFVSKAPDHVVQAERDRLADYQAQLAQVEELLAALC